MERKSKKWGFVVVGAVAAVALGAIAVASAATNQSASSSPSVSAQADGQGQDGQAHGPDFDGDGPQGRRDGGPGGHGGGAPDMAEALAKLSGEDVGTIMQQREAGKTFKQIAKAYGVSTDELLAETVKIEKAELDAAVKAGTLTDAQRSEILSGLQAHLEEELTETQAFGGDHGFGHDGDGTQAPSASSSPATSGASLIF